MELMRENKQYMQEWEEKGHQDWLDNNQRKADREAKELTLDKFLTQRYVNKIELKNSDASKEVVDGFEEFEETLVRLGIQTGANLEALDDHRPVSKGKKFSYAATMNKIKERKKLSDVDRKDKEMRQRKQKVEQRKTEQKMAYKNREDELLKRFTEKAKQKDSYICWRKI